MTLSRYLLALLLSSVLISIHTRAESPILEDRIVRLQSRPEVTVQVLDITPRDIPVWGGLLVYVGGSGAVGLKPDRAPGKRGGNFLFRTADMFALSGLTVSVIDNPSDSLQAVWNQRNRADHAEDGAAAIAHLRTLTNGPVWVIGTSMGTVSAASLAARLGPPPRGPDGVVVTSSIVMTSRNTTETVLTVDLESIRTPFLAVRHSGDECFASPPSGAESIVKRLKNATKVGLLTFTGGNSAESNECEPFAGHGFFGVERETVDGIISWMREAIPP